MGGSKLTPLPAGELPPICKALRGRTVDYTAVKGDRLIVMCTDGHQVEIAWEDDKPVLRRVNVNVQVPMPEAMGGLAGLGG